ncbi:MAG TPA: molybdopterin converting factor subunit 1 [Fulvivirga sp.]|nr:molybdopterin converting factor subunit 1 [Fulvivirga sp.]
MELKILLFGITKDIIGSSPHTLNMDGNTVANLRRMLIEKYPKLAGLKSILIAVNNEYADEELVIKEGDEVALIPPVSGG